MKWWLSSLLKIWDSDFFFFLNLKRKKMVSDGKMFHVLN